MDFVSDLHLKAARGRAWLIGDSDWMRRWLEERARSAARSPIEIKSGFGAQCLKMLHAHFPLARKAATPHWETQPRVPAGDPEGGQWTRLAGDMPSELPPQLPDQRPSSAKERNRKAKELARAGRPAGRAGVILSLIKAVGWAQEMLPAVVSYWDPPKSLEELQQAVKIPAAGYDIHHVVEQTSAEKFGYSRAEIDDPENLVRIPRLKHWEINSWFQKESKQFGGQSPREYLQNKDWDERRRVGLEALMDHGVLK